MGRPKGSGNKTPEGKAFVTRIERMLAKADPNTGSLERLACRLMTHAANEAMETKFFAHEGIVKEERELINWTARLKAAEIAKDVWRTLMAYKHGQPKESQETKHTIQVELKVDDADAIIRSYFISASTGSDSASESDQMQAAKQDRKLLPS